MAPFECDAAFELMIRQSGFCCQSHHSLAQRAAVCFARSKGSTQGGFLDFDFGPPRRGLLVRVLVIIFITNTMITTSTTT